jgi:hypothetical protein
MLMRKLLVRVANRVLGPPADVRIYYDPRVAEQPPSYVEQVLHYLRVRMYGMRR